MHTMTHGCIEETHTNILYKQRYDNSKHLIYIEDNMHKLLEDFNKSVNVFYSRASNSQLNNKLLNNMIQVEG